MNNKDKINLENYKPFYDLGMGEDEVKEILNQMWTHIECNFDKKIEKIIVIGSDAQVYISTSLDITQIERLKDWFPIVDDVDNCGEFDLITLNV